MEIKEIIEGCKQGNRLSQHKLYKYVYSVLMSMAYKYTHDRDECVDLLNQAFIKILDKIRVYDTELEFKNWYCTVGRNAMIDELRKNKRYKERMVLSDTFIPLSTPNCHNEERNNGLTRLLNIDTYKVLDKLGEVRKKVVEMQIFEGFTHKQISKELGITESLSKWHLVQAKNYLRKNLVV